MNRGIHYEVLSIKDCEDRLLELVKNFWSLDLDGTLIEDSVISQIEEYIGIFKESIYFLVEFPYVDKVYRDSYYSYFSSKHQAYNRDSIRIILFKKKIDLKDVFNIPFHKTIQKDYLGFFTLRPTLKSIIGRSHISKKALKKGNITICECTTEISSLGQKLSVSGFPHSAQDGETLRCAETSVWALMEYFGNRYPEYKPTLPSKIHSSIEQIITQRQLPSIGLNVEHISFALKKFGFGTRIYSRSAYGDKLIELIDIYLESGIPIVLGLEAIVYNNDAEGGEIEEIVGHAILAIGKEKTKGNTIPKIVSQDDNLPPYQLIDPRLPGRNRHSEAENKFEIDSIVVPLYPKIYLDADMAQTVIRKIAGDPTFGSKACNGSKIKVFLCSSRSFKQHLLKNKNLSLVIKQTLLIMKLPKFIWLGEIEVKNQNDGAVNQSIGLILLDATEANNEASDAFMFGGYTDRCVTYIENNLLTLQQPFEGYQRYTNLK